MDDAEDVVRYVATNAEKLNIDAGRIAVGGDSAGGNLAAVVSILCRDSNGPAIKFQLLIYPATDMEMGHPSHTLFAEGYNLTRDLMHYFRGHYLNDMAEIKDWRASPLYAKNLANLPPAYVITAGFDPLRDEGKEFADKLTLAGNKVLYECFDGMIHGFITMSGVLKVANEAIAECGKELRAYLN